jgi:neutral amino acid transport system permease protein
VNLGRAIADGLRAGIGVPAIVFALAASGLNLQFGYAGLINVGQVGFLLVGAYGTAITVDAGAPLLVGVLVGIGAAVALGFVLGLSTLRLRADYLAIVTLASAEVLRLSVRSRLFEGTTGGVDGIRGFADSFYDWNPIPVGRYGVGDVAFSHRSLWLMLVGWSAVALTSLIVWRLVNSPWGRAVAAVREDEDVARSLGKDVFVIKVQCLVLGGSIGALGGILLAIDSQYVEPDFWVLALTTYAFTAVVLGGKGTVLGPVVGAMVLWFLLQGADSVLRQWLEDGILDGRLGPNDASPIRFAAVGLALMLLMAFRGRGTADPELARPHAA